MTARPDFWVIALNETEYWNLAEHAVVVDQVECVYFFDKNAETYLCEMTPSYCLFFVGSRPVFKDGILNDSPEACAAYEYIMEGDFEYSPDAVYLHCRHVESILDSVPHKRLGDMFPNESRDTYEEMVDSVREYLRGNEVC